MSYFIHAVSVDQFVLDINTKLADPNWQIDSTWLTELMKYRLFAEQTKVEYDISFPEKYDSPAALEKLKYLFQLTQSFRDRVLEIKLSALPNRRKLIQYQEKVETFIYTHHYDDIKEYRNQAERLAVIRGVFPILFEMLNEYNSVIETADMILQNLTDTHFTLSRIEAIARIIDGHRISTNKVY